MFKSVYNKAINDKLFKATDKKTHAAFVQVGQVFLKFLKSKPAIHKAPSVALKPPSHHGSHLTIKEAVIRVLEIELHGMTAEQIYNKIIADGLYSFGDQALDTLFSCENAPYIVLRDIALTWFSGLPELSNGLQWTPLLLQELLRIRPNIGYRVILPNLKGQALDTVGATIVPCKSEIETFADIVHRFSFEKYNLPFKLPAEELRLDLREAGMLDGNQLIYNMHKTLKDHRFAFSDENRTVMILER